ncbi:MAG: GatB/YqeY domain-containing protein [Omnitrophica bacterium]|nr:GatB/YqeY domain-containing protein [Candidatus Omnitrophota bacterium]
MLEDKIYQDYVEALKSRNKSKSEFLSFIRSELKNEAINLKVEKLDDSQALIILKKQQKRLLDTKEAIVSSQRNDLLQNIEQESNILNQYLPKPLKDAELLQIVEEVISKTKASSMRDMGRVMKEVLTRVGIKADSKNVSSLVKEKLSSL